MYIYERPNWPNFFWDEKKITDLLIQLRHQQGRLIGGMESVGFSAQDEAVLQAMTQEVVKSSEIEGEFLDQALVRSSIARHLGLEKGTKEPVNQHVEGVVEMMMDAMQNYKNPLTKERLFRWHTALFPDGRSGLSKIQTGDWRAGMVEVVSGHMGKEVIHFEAPPADRVDPEMKGFLKWMNEEQPIDEILKAGIAHLWFLTIHPFDDGNGRIGRAIADLLLAKSEKNPQRFYSLSAQIQIERKGYYAILEQTQKGTLDITTWLEWFFGCLGRAIKHTSSTLEKVLRKAHYWESLGETSLNTRQKKVLNRLLDGFEGKLTSSKWAKIAKCSQDTAYRDIVDLADKGILKKNPEGGRSTSYSLIFPQEEKS